MKKLTLIAAILSVLMIFVVACSSQQALKTTPTTAGGKDFQPNKESNEKLIPVLIQGFKFVPADVTVKVGDTVIWTNEDSAPHTVESSDGALKSDELSKGDKFTYTFTKAGKYEYSCGIHTSMHGSVTVQ